MTKKVRLYCFLILLALQFCDWASTMLVIARGGTEANPIAFFGGISNAKVLASLICFLIVWRATKPKTIGISMGFMFAVVAWNIGSLLMN